ncbi:hypothetical protein TC41_0002 [Alicyclobacillus acidocaldarius subsp. acidocaldarius Tc-4-1]|uniref:Uncharacterized protein n=1 Tax=Alicyclobacillus acidocaldarius (strain Tc-4-1) TaxID=1048834 RepID=F8IHL7_ALIAT|nr:hypothetical protein TC41_0002 [Alicyclobacillus acidocaldarius subsp. acidocaldarius Tc-4-1]
MKTAARSTGCPHIHRADHDHDDDQDPSLLLLLILMQRPR